MEINKGVNIEDNCIKISGLIVKCNIFQYQKFWPVQGAVYACKSIILLILKIITLTFECDTYSPIINSSSMLSYKKRINILRDDCVIWTVLVNLVPSSNVATYSDYVKGSDNIPADMLSIIEALELPNILDYAAVAQAQITDT